MAKGLRFFLHSNIFIIYQCVGLIDRSTDSYMAATAVGFGRVGQTRR